MTDFTHRLRLHGGRNYHAARRINGGAGLVTACDYLAGPRDEDLDGTATVTCRKCAASLKRLAQR
ncbi:hypothetical protein [Streptomyces enissocaesilis]|uniref:Uncharacterized protein n=1 Tax=Streptomyces enissocaesilis TaxID=332589 RepID=A0ABN3WXJ0_9ACTN